jgi:hypothetical protein
MTAHEARKLQKRKKACLETARSWSSVREELKMRRKLGRGIASVGRVQVWQADGGGRVTGWEEAAH